MNFVPCLMWVKRGVSKHVPDKLQLSKEELKRLALESAEQLRVMDLKDEEDPKESEMDAVENDNMQSLNDEYNLDAYDDDNDDKAEEQKCAPIFKAEDLDVAFEDSNKVTPEDAFDDDEKEDFLIKENDNLMVVGHVENESSTLEVYVYNEEAGDFYVHHDIILPAYPIALEWLNFKKSSNLPGSYVAVGDLTPVVNIWNLDVIDMLEPTCTLGCASEPQDDSRNSHHDSVLCLGWNEQSRNILASGSADEKILLWDLESETTANNFDFQKGKVQSLQWHPQEPQYLLSGTTDGYVILGDCRAPVSSFTFFTVDGEVERVLWDHFHPFFFFISTEKGTVYCMDIRTQSEAYNFKAHESAVTGLTLSQSCSGCLATSSTDKNVKIWDVSDKPKFIAAQKLKIGHIFAASFCPDSPFILACGGGKSSNNVVIKSILEFENCEEVFANRLNSNCL